MPKCDLNKVATHEVKELDVRLTTKSEKDVSFSVIGFTKTTEQWNKRQILFSKEDSLCRYKSLELYLELRRAWKGKADRDELLLSQVKPRRPVLIATVTCWTKEVLGLSRKDI